MKNEICDNALFDIRAFLKEVYGFDAVEAARYINRCYIGTELPPSVSAFSTSLIKSGGVNYYFEYVQGELR